MSDGISTKIDLQYADDNIVFGIAYCCADKDNSFWKLDRIEAEEFLAKIKHIEKMTWKQFSALPREDGLTTEFPGSKTYTMIDNQNTMEAKLFEKYYFHFRIKKNSLFRVFGYQYKNIFYITHLDPKGKLQH